MAVTKLKRALALRLFRNAYPPGHFYSPLPRLGDAPQLTGAGSEGTAVIPGIDLRQHEQLALLRELRELANDQPWESSTSTRYSFENEFFGAGDALVLHGLVRMLEPAHIVEVGSGYSSACILDTIDRHLTKPPTCTFIEPYPARLQGLLRPSDTGVRLEKRSVQGADTAIFDALRPNDILFIDSSHVSKVGSDVNYLVFEVLPALEPGVWVHFHDIHFPFDYPPAWLAAGRAWNEAYLLRAFLCENPNFQIRIWNSYLAGIPGQDLAGYWPAWGTNPGGSIWLERV